MPAWLPPLSHGKVTGNYMGEDPRLSPARFWGYFSKASLQTLAAGFSSISRRNFGVYFGYVLKDILICFYGIIFGFFFFLWYIWWSVWYTVVYFRKYLWYISWCVCVTGMFPCRILECLCSICCSVFFFRYNLVLHFITRCYYGIL